MMDVCDAPRTAVLTGMLEAYGRLVRSQERLDRLRGRLEAARRHAKGPGGDRALALILCDRLRARSAEAAEEVREAKRLGREWLGLADSVGRLVG